MKASINCINLIKESEGFRDKAYKCPAGIWTIGFGFTKGVKPSDTTTLDEAIARLAVELEDYEAGVLEHVRVPLTQGQFDALVDFAFNLGVGALSESTLLRKLNDGDLMGAANEFPRWVKSGGKTLPGLVKRRAAERALFLS